MRSVSLALGGNANEGALNLDGQAPDLAGAARVQGVAATAVADFGGELVGVGGGGGGGGHLIPLSGSGTSSGPLGMSPDLVA